MGKQLKTSRAKPKKPNKSHTQKTKEALRKSELAFRSLFEAIPVGTALLVNRKIARVNPALCTMTGYSHEDLEGQSAQIAYRDDEEFERVGKILYAQIAQGGRGITEAHFRRKNGEEFEGLLIANPLDPQDPSAGVVATVVDITERKHAEVLLARNLHETSVRFDISQALVGKETEDEVLDALIQQANLDPQAYMSIVTFEKVDGELIGILRRVDPFQSGIITLVPLGTRFPATQFTSIKRYVADQSFISEDIAVDERMDSDARELIRRGGGNSFAAFPLTASNEWVGIVIALSKTRGYFDEEKQHLYQTLAEQGAVALRAARMRETIRESQQRLSLLIEQSPLAVIEWNLNLEVVSWNPAAEQIFGYKREEALGRHVLGLLLPETMKHQLEQAFQDILVKKVDFRILDFVLTKDGRSIITEWFNAPLIGPDGKLVGAVCLAQDITEHKKAEEEKAKLEDQLRQAQKMEAVGRLAGGVAHDFNNMLSVIIGYTNLIKTQLPTDEPLLKDILEIERAATRSREVTSQLLAFSRKQTITPRILDLNDVVNKMQNTLARLIGEDVDLRFCPGEDPWKIKFDPSQLEQILMNLAINARDAMPEGGKLTIETANVYIDEVYCSEHLGFKPGYYAMLGVSDDGVGMDKETLEHVFEPFFTTKTIGKGTGLGLSMVYGIVKQNDGFINIYSEPKRGTLIKIYLPRSTEEEKLKEIEIVPVVPQSGTVLLVEDDDSVRLMTTKMLEAIGYTVLPVDNPLRALSLCEQSENKIDFVLTDVVMPQISGKELSERIKTLRPEIKTIYMSGYTANVIAHRGILEDGVCLLQKPFTMSELAKKIREVMGNY